MTRNDQHDRAEERARGRPRSCRATSGCRWRASAGSCLSARFVVVVRSSDRGPTDDGPARLASTVAVWHRQCRRSGRSRTSATAGRGCGWARSRRRTLEVVAVLCSRRRPGDVSSAVTRDRDPRTPAEALEGPTRRARPRWRRRRPPPAAADAPAATPGDDGRGHAGRRRTAVRRSGRRRRPPHRPRRRPAVKPDPPYVAAAKSRLKIPFWAMAALSLLPLWVFMYVRSAHRAAGGRHRPARRRRRDLQHLRQSCHGAGGEGGVGRPFADGEVAEDVPAHRGPAAVRLLRHGRVQPAGVDVYGNPDRQGGRTVGSSA